MIPPYRWTHDAKALERTRAIAMDATCLRRKCEEDHDLGYEMMKRFVPVLIERLQGERTALVQLRGGKSLKPGAVLTFVGGGQQVNATAGDVVGEFRQLQFDRPLRDWLDTIGELPLPPYIARQAGSDDDSRY